jgi:nitrite reductase/ring-hydroxylating ferredoxin subunit
MATGNGQDPWNRQGASRLAQRMTSVSRRSLLGGVGAVCLLAACGRAEAPPAVPQAEAPPAVPPSTTPSTTTSSTTTATNAGLVALNDIPIGGGVIVAGPTLVVRLAGDVVKAYSAVCPHATITVGTPDATGRITCPGHGSHFRAADGSLIDGPAPRGLTAVAVTVKNGQVVPA